MKINIIGTSVSGKTVFSKQLAEKLNYPHIELDRIFWGPNWYWPSDEEFFAKLKKSLNGDNWILDGHYTRTTPIAWENVNLVIWLDYSFATTFLRAVKRAITRIISREEIWPETGNRESLRRTFFSKSSIILWTIKTYKRKRMTYENFLHDPHFSHVRFVRLRNHNEAKTFLRKVGELKILRLTNDNHNEAQDFYTSVGYEIKIKSSEIVIAAYENSIIVGVVRLDIEKNHCVLRGMQVSRARLCSGIGKQMLFELEKHIGNRDCYCIPHNWLIKFYGLIGFKEIPHGEAPPYLIDRFLENRKKHPHLIIMKRPTVL